MAPESSILTLERRIEDELARVNARATELRVALKVVAELGTEAEAEEAIEEPTNGTETRRIILKPTDDVPEAVKSRLTERSESARKLADSTFDLERT